MDNRIIHELSVETKLNTLRTGFRIILIIMSQVYLTSVNFIHYVICNMSMFMS